MRTLLPCLVVAALAATSPAAEPEVVGGEWLALASVDTRGRQPFNPDAVFARYLLQRDSAPPVEAEEVRGSREKPAAWAKVTADDDGTVKGRFAYCYKKLHRARARVVLAELRGGATLWVNGDAFTGDVYGQGMGPVPVALREGDNHVFVRGIRGSFRLTLRDAGTGYVLTGRDTTRPDIVTGSRARGELAVVVANATPGWMHLVRSSSGAEGGVFAPQDLSLNVRLPPLAVMKVPVPFAMEGQAAPDPGELELPLAVTSSDGMVFGTVKLQVRSPEDARRITFRSAIDDSVQEYSVRQPSTAHARGLVLSLHGASVDALNQARSYSAKPDMWIVAATNRRPFGFDWQDWGRRDGYEVLAEALTRTGADRRRVYVTGHSMGGHGTWHFGANDPDGFAALAPSAGWSQFDHYGGGRPDAARREPWHAADGPSDTLALVSNLVQLPTFVLHGTKDDNVPLSEAERMLQVLRATGGTPESHFQEGAGHWWNGDAAEGADCVDWPAIFELFRKHTIPAAPREIDFLSVAPGVDAEHYWVRVEQPLRYGAMLRVQGSWTDDTVTLATENVRRLRVALPGGAAFRRVVLDSTSIGFDTPRSRQWFVRGSDGWAPADGGAAEGEKTAALSGPFKRAFDNRFLLVVGTAGSDEETRELLARARHDASVWWYRGNGRAEIVTDVDFAFGRYPGRNVILYGNAVSNAAWDIAFDDDCPVRASRGAIGVGDRRWEADDLCLIFVHRRRGDPNALAAAFADSGVAGTRLGYSLLPFVSGVGYPDYALFGPEVLTPTGSTATPATPDPGVLTAGWFTPTWQLQGLP